MHIKEPIIEIHQIDLKNAKLNKVYKISQSMLFALNKKKILDFTKLFHQSSWLKKTTPEVVKTGYLPKKGNKLPAEIVLDLNEKRLRWASVVRT